MGLLDKDLSVPKVSVIIPVYNRRELLAEAVSSVLKQTLIETETIAIEIIIVDDGSDDSPEKIIPALPQDSDREIKIIKINHNGHPGFVRNRGVEVSRGEFIAFLDSDDLWMPDKLEKQRNFMLLHPEVPLIHTKEIWKRGDKIVSQSKRRHKREGFIFNDALEKCILGPSTVMIRRSMIDQVTDNGKVPLFNEELEVAEDYELWLRITDRFPIGYIDKELIIKRGGLDDQLSFKYGQIEIFHLQALYHLLKNNIISKENRFQTIETFKKKIDIYAQGCRKREKFEEAELWEKRIIELSLYEKD